MVLSVIALEDERGVGAAEPEGVGKGNIEFRIVDALTNDRHIGKIWIDLFDMRAFTNEASLHHQQRIDRFLNAGRAERMARQRLGGLNVRDLGAEDFADRSHFLGVTHGRGCAMRVDVVNLAFNCRERLPHAADCAFAGGATIS